MCSYFESPIHKPQYPNNSTNHATLPLGTAVFKTRSVQLRYSTYYAQGDRQTIDQSMNERVGLGCERLLQAVSAVETNQFPVLLTLPPPLPLCPFPAPKLFSRIYRTPEKLILMKWLDIYRTGLYNQSTNDNHADLKRFKKIKVGN